ncbi:unnamed protein product [Paramecium sonneborni]|uniref:Uncharacterized protein n=1 Tax=Paramecium sonneborni TaxID=65129 RepID=A0A8S1RRU7_9CILI|nr:unnamed protein product [Paramecium sonneborni]
MLFNSTLSSIHQNMHFIFYNKQDNISNRLHLVKLLLNFQILNEDSNFQQLRLQCPGIPLIQLQITDYATSPKEQLNFSYVENNKFKLKTIQKNLIILIQPQNQIEFKINTNKKDRNNESISQKREKKSLQQKRDNLMIQEINYMDKGIYVNMEFQSNQFKNNANVQLRDIEEFSPLQDVLIIMRNEGDSSASSITKRKSMSQNNKKQQLNIPNQFINNQTQLYIRHPNQNPKIRQLFQINRLGLLPTSAFSFYQELFKEKQKLQLKIIQQLRIKEYKIVTKEKQRVNIYKFQYIKNEYLINLQYHLKIWLIAITTNTPFTIFFDFRSFF